MVSTEQIEEVGRLIAERFKPERIILFGSYAEGHPTEDSDVDLLIVATTTETPVDLSVKIRLDVRPPFPLDVLVRTPSKMRERLEMGDSFMRRIVEKGKLLYEAHNS